ncbi:MAG: ScyD/ScyE family protein [Dehalococcoidia bacterium]
MRFPAWFPIAVVLVAGALGAALGMLLGWLGDDSNAFGHFDKARSVHVAPDGRLIIADLGTGKDDGRVVAVRRGEAQEVLMSNLPSTRNSGQAHSDLAGPSGAATNAAGVSCVVVGDGPRSGFGTMQCTNGLVVDLKAFERTNNPDGRAVESNPFDIVSDGADGWVVSDAAANDVLHVSANGQVTVLGVFWPQDSGQPEGVPTGLDYAFLGNRFRHVAFGLFGGGIGIFDLGRDAPLPEQPRGSPVVAVALNRFANSGNEEFLCTLEWEDVESGGDMLCAGEQVRSFDHPTGIAQVAPGEYVVIEAGQPVMVELPRR